MVPNDPSQRPSQRPSEPGKWKAFGLAVFMHLLLVAALVFSLSWNRSTPGPVQAELWTALPAPNDPVPDTPPAPPTPPVPPQPVPPPPPEPPQVTQENPDIAIEREKKRKQEEDQQRAAADEAERQRQKQLADQKAADQKKAAEKAAAEKAAADKAAADKATADKAAADKLAAEKTAAADKAAAAKADAEKKAQAERDRKLREAFRNDASKAAGLTTGQAGGREGGTADRNQAGGGGGDAGYAALIRACVKPGVIYNAGDAGGGNPMAVFQVQLMPSGDQAGPPILKSSSGVSAFDSAVENGLRRCNPFPSPPSGRYPSSIVVQYRMFD